MPQAFADSPDYFDELKNAGAPADQARVHVKILRRSSEVQTQFVLKKINNYDRILRGRTRNQKRYPGFTHRNPVISD